MLCGPPSTETLCSDLALQRKSSFISQLRGLEFVNSVYHVIEEVEQTPSASFTSHLVSNEQEQHERKGSTERNAFCLLR